jgi:predicted ATPase
MVLAEEQSFPIWSAGGLIAQGWVLAEGAQKGLGLQRMHQGLEAWRATGAQFLVPYFLGLLAEAYGKVGQIEEGLSLLSQALAHAENSGERWFEAELHRLRGTLLLSRSEPDAPQADMSFQRALSIAHTQGARLWEVRAATSLCRAWFDQGKRIEGSALLKPIYEAFTEGFDTADLLTAKTLLDSFGGAEPCDSPSLIRS